MDATLRGTNLDQRFPPPRANLDTSLKHSMFTRKRWKTQCRHNPNTATKPTGYAASGDGRCAGLDLSTGPPRPQTGIVGTGAGWTLTDGTHLRNPARCTDPVFLNPSLHVGKLGSRNAVSTQSCQCAHLSPALSLGLRCFPNVQENSRNFPPYHILQFYRVHVCEGHRSVPVSTESAGCKWNISPNLDQNSSSKLLCNLLRIKVSIFSFKVVYLCTHWLVLQKIKAGNSTLNIFTQPKTFLLACIIDNDFFGAFYFAA